MRCTPMMVLYVYCHPLPESYHAAIRAEATGALAEAGHDVDLLDVYAEGFDAAASWPMSKRRCCAFEHLALP